ncbi:MAG: thiamine pyrophosphate-binding protein [Actinomycetota bacterium]
MSMNGGSLLARSLRDVVPVVFALHGGHLDAFFMGCVEEGIELVDVRHEAAAVNAADGYARVSGGLGVAAVTSGPGFTNAIAGISNAYADGVPVLIITASPPLRESETRELQGGIDQIALAYPITKWAHRVTSADRIPDLLALAVRHALGGKPGPVVLDIPIDIAFANVDETRLSAPGRAAIGARPVPAPSVVAQTAELLRTAERPVVVCGEGTLWSDGIDAAVVAFAERTGIPVFHSGPNWRSLPARHRLNGQGLTSLLLLGPGGPDVIMLCGAPMGMFTGGTMTLPAATKVVQVDHDAAEIGRLRPVDIAAAGDPAGMLRALAELPGAWPDRAAWAELATSAHVHMESMFAEAPTMIGDRIHPYHAAREALSALDPGAIVVQDGGETQCWGTTAGSAADPSLVISLGYQGHLGVGAGYALGAHYASPSDQVLVLTGDGAVGFHIQELDTMVRHGVPVVTVVFANDTWGMSNHGQHLVYGREVISRLTPTAYDQIAIAFGGHGERVTDPAEVAPAVRRAFASGLPAIVNVVVSNEVVHPITLTLLGNLAGEGEIVVPYYQNLPDGSA